MAGDRVAAIGEACSVFDDRRFVEYPTAPVPTRSGARSTIAGLYQAASASLEPILTMINCTFL